MLNFILIFAVFYDIFISLKRNCNWTNAFQLLTHSACNLHFFSMHSASINITSFSQFLRYACGMQAKVGERSSAKSVLQCSTMYLQKSFNLFYSWSYGALLLNSSEVKYLSVVKTHFKNLLQKVFWIFCD